MASLACSAAAGLGRWDDIAIYERFLSNDVADSHLYRALLYAKRYMYIWIYIYTYTCVLYEKTDALLSHCIHVKIA